MNRMMIGAVALVMGMGSSLACAETRALRADGEQDEQMLSRADLNALTDARLGVIKAALQMTPDQAKYWPAPRSLGCTQEQRRGRRPRRHHAGAGEQSHPERQRP